MPIISKKYIQNCSYCKKASKKVGSDVIYPHRPDLYSKIFYYCKPCTAWVGCHPNTDKPLGRLANAELRKLKSAAHAIFDPLWKNGIMRRSYAYAWLSQSLGIDGSDCHIGMFDEELCRRTVEVVSAYLEKSEKKAVAQ